MDLNGTKITGYYALNLQGDVIAIIDSNGAAAVTYEYDAWGREVAKTTAVTYGQNLYSYNKLKYRGYYFDSDLGLYYLNSRFYDPNVGRFLGPDNPEVVLASQTTITDKNLYAYCDNNPVMRVDGQGNFWDLIGDIWSLGCSVMDVIEDPTDPWAWASLGGDVLDLAVPFFSGGGETVRTVKAVNNVVDAVDDTVDTAKLANRTEDVFNVVENIDSTIDVGKITGYTKHGLEQAMGRNGIGVNPEAILDAVKNPKKTVEKIDEFGRYSIQYRGRMATTVLNQEGKIVSCWAKSSKYGRIK